MNQSQLDVLCLLLLVNIIVHLIDGVALRSRIQSGVEDIRRNIANCEDATFRVLYAIVDKREKRGETDSQS